MKSLISKMLGLVVLFAACGQDQTQEINRLNAELTELQAAVGPPPAALDGLFPPKADAPTWVLQMQGMAFPLMSLGVDAIEGDMENAKTNFQHFSDAYTATSQLVPEWTGHFPREPVEELGAAVEAGDVDRLMAALEGVGHVCHSCHLKNMAKVQARYDWGNFNDLIVKDPITNEEVVYAGFMRNVEMSLVGAINDLGQGQLDAARGHFRDFDARFQELKQACEFCHDTPRAYYVDDASQKRIDALGKALNAASPDPQAIMQIVEGIGFETCHKCHLVHVPATYAKAEWGVAK